jgi:hypothetical protein
MSRLREFRQRIEAAKASFIEPCLPTFADKPPSGPRWIHEIKHDGYACRRARTPTACTTHSCRVWLARNPCALTKAYSLIRLTTCRPRKVCFTPERRPNSGHVGTSRSGHEQNRAGAASYLSDAFSTKVPVICPGQHSAQRSVFADVLVILSSGRLI